MAKTPESPAAPVAAALPVTAVTRFERARIIGARALQIGLGAPLLIKITDARETLNPVACAEREYDEGVIPITVLKRR